MRQHSIRRLIAGACLLAYARACSYWQGVPGSPPAPLPEGRDQVRISLKDGSQLTLEKAKIVGDSLIGEKVSFSGSAGGDERVRIAVANKFDCSYVPQGLAIAP